MTISVLDVAEYILEKQGPMSTMKLQKLVYYSQAWSLVWDEDVLFPEPIEAWANGPVVRDLWNRHQGVFRVSAGDLGGSSQKLSPTQRESVDAVLDYYGDKPAQWLSDLTHEERPWKRARKGLDEGERGFREISPESLQDFYSSL